MGCRQAGLPARWKSPHLRLVMRSRNSTSRGHHGEDKLPEMMETVAQNPGLAPRFGQAGHGEVGALAPTTGWGAVIPSRVADALVHEPDKPDSRRRLVGAKVDIVKLLP